MNLLKLIEYDDIYTILIKNMSYKKNKLIRLLNKNLYNNNIYNDNYLFINNLDINIIRKDLKLNKKYLNKILKNSKLKIVNNEIIEIENKNINTIRYLIIQEINILYNVLVINKYIIGKFKNSLILLTEINNLILNLKKNLDIKYKNNKNINISYFIKKIYESPDILKLKIDIYYLFEIYYILLLNKNKDKIEYIIDNLSKNKNINLYKKILILYDNNIKNNILNSINNNNNSK
tara:strand:- start:8755 stop:9456 length:702 start_codon:yes stop_codon:yes gene_type:complete